MRSWDSMPMGMRIFLIVGMIGGLLLFAWMYATLLHAF